MFDAHFPRESEPTFLGILWAQHLVWWFPWALFVGAAALNRLDSRAHPLAALPAVWLLIEESRLSLWRARLGDDPTPIVARSGTRVLVGAGAFSSRW